MSWIIILRLNRSASSSIRDLAVLVHHVLLSCLVSYWPFGLRPRRFVSQIQKLRR